MKIVSGRRANFYKYIALFRTSLMLCCALALHTAVSHAQSTFGGITGTVTDPSGAVVPGADVELKAVATGTTRSTVSDSKGEFSLVNLDAGIYVVTVKANGFVTREFNDIHLLARETARLDAQLKVGASNTQNVEVTAGAEDITAELTTGDTKSGAEINTLALNFRASSNTSPIVVANLAPQVQTDQAGNISIAGGLPNATSFSIDGISTQSVRNGGPTKDLFPSVESIAEFKVNTGSNNAEFGQVSDLTVTTKSGTNQYHGSLFYFHQNAAFNAANPFVHKVLPIIANDFGVTLGGPVSIPHVYDGKDKTFFFFTYEGTRRPSTSPINIIVPSTSERAGFLSSPALNPCTGQVTTDFSNCINPFSAKVLDALFPLPNQVNGPDDAENQYTIKGNYHVDGYDGRLDQVITPNQRVYARYTHKDLTNVGNAGLSSYNPLLGAFSDGLKLRNFVASYNWVIRPTLVNEARGGFTWVNEAQQYAQAAQGAALAASFGISNLPPTPSSGGVPDFQVGSYVGGATNSVGRPRHVQQHIYDFSDNLTWILGGHSLKFGGNYRHDSYIDQITFTNGDEFGDYYYTGQVLGNALGEFLAGFPLAADYAQNGPDGKPFTSHYGFFGQDDWKVSRRLTLSYGIRYEINPPFDDETHQLGQFDRNFPGGRLITQGEKGLALVSPSWRANVGDTPFITNSQAGLPITLRHTYYGNVQPRFGFAYDVYGNSKTIVKAHVGSYSVPVLGAVLYSLLGVNTSNFPEFVTSATNPLVFPNVFGAGGTYPVNCNSPSTLPAGATAGSPSCPGYRRANQENLKDPRVVQWNASLEQDLGYNTVLRLLYTGSHSTQLIYSPDLNQLHPNTVGYTNLTATPALRQANLKYPNFSEVLTRDNGLSAKYNAMTAELQRRFAKNLMFDASYTWAKNLSNALGSAPSSLIGDGGQGDNGPNTLNYFDTRADVGNVIFTRRNRFVNTFVYQLPFGRGQQFMGTDSRALDLLVGGWDLTGITVLQTGPFLTPTFTGTDPSGTNPTQRSAGGYQRPDCVAGVNPNRHVGGSYFNPAAFSVPGNNIGRFGNCSVGTLIGPGTQIFSLTAGKDLHLTEGISLRYEAAFSNLLNIENLGTPDTRITDASFGQISNVQSSEEAGPRTIQMSLRLKF